MPFADIYARYYNLLYKDKDYPAEFRYLNAIISLSAASANSILDLGCGTGKHLRCFQDAGYNVAGVDVSAAMLAAAQEQLGEGVDLINAKISEFYTDKKFNVITSLFHVMSYQADTAELAKVLANVAEHLADGGLFIFDFWYGPAVLTDLPAVRIKRLADEEIKITRITEPVMRYNENIVEVNFELLIEPKTGGGA
ncbi:hypothetical protein AGMMS49959_19380 [Planctomycetales bacterium]|nr:hypothetical protein AGMMS49959_19380 [Planctomycetales bacterium]